MPASVFVGTDGWHPTALTGRPAIVRRVKAWIFLVLLAAALAWMVWAQARMQHRTLAFLVARAGGSARRGAAVTHLVQGGAFVLAVLALVGAVALDERWNAAYLRIPVGLAVLLAYVPLAATLAPTRLRRIRRTVTQRMNDLGAPPDVAAAIARAGRPWSLACSVVMLAAVLVVTWHHLRA